MWRLGEIMVGHISRVMAFAGLVVSGLACLGVPQALDHAQAGPALRYWATVDNPFPFPGPGRFVTVTGYFTVDGLPARGIHMATVWRSASTTGYCYGVTRADGTANCTRQVTSPLMLIGMSVEI